MNEPKRFCAVRYEDDGEYCEEFNAVNFKRAEEICDQLGWTLLGELMTKIDAQDMTRQQVNDLCDRRNSGIAGDA